MKKRMKPSKKLDALIAEKIFGCPVKYDAIFNRQNEYSSHAEVIYICRCETQHILPYSTDIAAAWKVAEKLTDWPKIKVKLYVYPQKLDFMVSFSNNEWAAGLYLFEHDGPASVFEVLSSESAPHAICLAALKAAGEIS